MRTLTVIATGAILLGLLFQCSPCTALQLPAIPTPTTSFLQSVRATLTAEAVRMAPRPTPTSTRSPTPQPTAADSATCTATPTSPTVGAPVPPPTPTAVPTFTAVTIGPMELGQFGTYEGLSMSVLWREWTDFRMTVSELRIDAEPGHHILWIHVRAQNRGDSPVGKPIGLRFDLWYQGRQVDGIFEDAPQNDPHQPGLRCGPYRMMNPGEACEGWLYFFPDIPGDWSGEELAVSYGGFCDAESHLFPPSLYWRLE